MSGKVAIVAGGGPLGRATAVTLAARGLSVVAVDRNEQALRELPDAVVPEVADTTDPNTAKSVVDRIAAQVGPPGILVNTIGAFRPGDALSTTPEDLRLMVDVNLGTGLWLSQAVAPHMQRNGSGAIVHVSSRPLRPHGIRVNGVAPQLLDTAKNRAQFPADTMAHATAPEAIADVIAFLVSDAAAPVSGAILPAYGA
jgi:NAD(P)-dependent dehydrogenase (short-subunit alcohol dehydrogenase family)